ncbi:MAG: Na/Pi cotransporter family protein [Lachnospiraceae bacterium]|nr:Na/Pi cotransporter family protein [Lachnospiraceae bacterium]
MNITMILAMIGGLGLFLYGMRLMGDSIERAAGAKLRNILETLTRNRVQGMFVGLFFTAVIQSSSACTVMVVSFVNSGLMTLYQAAGPILGANIGTTVTSQLVSFNLSKAAPVFLIIGVLVSMFSKNATYRKIADIITGFGVLFLGLSQMSSSMSVLKDSEAVLNVFSSLTNPFLGILLGAALTALIQSSSVTVSILLLLANQGLIALPISMFIILGCNIGACMSAVLAGIAGNRDAKRAALIHLIFNIIGTIIVAAILFVLMPQVLSMLTAISGSNPGRIIANAHTVFKIFQVALLLPFTDKIVDMTYVLVPKDKDHEEKVGYRSQFQLQYIGAKVIFSPATAVVDAIKELDRMANLASENLNRAMNALITLDEEDIAEVYEVEKNIDFLNHAITNYLVKINQTNMPVDDLKQIGALFHVVNDIERIGDHAENVADMAKERLEKNVVFSKEAQREMGDLLDMVNTIVRFSIEMFSKDSDEHMEDVMNLEDAIDEKERELQNNHIARLEKNECSPEAGMIYSDVVSGLERVADHATNIAFAIRDSERQDLTARQVSYKI